MAYKERRDLFELQVGLEGYVRRQGIQVVLFDYDDTLIDSHSLFAKQGEAFFKFCEMNMNEEEMVGLREVFGALDVESFKMLGVSQRKWNYVIERLCEVYGREDFREGLCHFEEIYLSSPEVHEGSVETLKVFKQVVKRLGLVTHAAKPWTEIKLERTGMREYFEHIKSIDVEEHRFKGAEHWREAIEEFGVDPSVVMVVGDNLRGDIMAANQVGVRNLVYVPGRWHIYAQGEVPEGTIVIPSIKELVPTLAGL